MEELNTVACYLPEYDAQTVQLVVDRLKEDNIPVAAANIIKNPADVGWFGEAKKAIERKLKRKQEAGDPPSPAPDVLCEETPAPPMDEEDEFAVNLSGDDFGFSTQTTGRRPGRNC